MFFTPVIRLTNGTANWILRRLGIEPAEELRSARSPQELVSLVRNSARRGSLDPATAALVDRSLQFGARTAEELMTPRSKIEALQADDTVADLIAAAIETGYSRFPIIEGDLDETIGMIHIKQVFEVPPERRAATPLSSPGAARRQGAVHPRRRRGDDSDPRERLADRAGRRRVRRHRGHGHRRGPHRGDRRRRPRRTRRRDSRRAAGRPTAGACPGCCASTKSPTRPDSARPKANTKPSAVWCCKNSATSPSEPTTVELTAFDPDGPRRRPGAVAGHRRPDGRPPDRPAGAARAWPDGSAER